MARYTPSAAPSPRHGELDSWQVRDPLHCSVRQLLLDAQAASMSSRTTPLPSPAPPVVPCLLSPGTHLLPFLHDFLTGLSVAEEGTLAVLRTCHGEQVTASTSFLISHRG